MANRKTEGMEMAGKWEGIYGKLCTTLGHIDHMHLPPIDQNDSKWLMVDPPLLASHSQRLL